MKIRRTAQAAAVLAAGSLVLAACTSPSDDDGDTGTTGDDATQTEDAGGDTGTTGKLIQQETGLPVERMLSGPLGGDQQIGGRVASETIDAVIFLRDPLTAQPHEPDITALLRVCDVHNVPLATNRTSAELLLLGLAVGLPKQWRARRSQETDDGGPAVAAGGEGAPRRE